MEKLKAFDVDLKRLFFEILKRLWLMALVGVVCGAAMFVGAKFFITPQYTATASIYVQNYSGENDQKIYGSDLSASQSLVKTYSALMTSENILSKVVKKLDNRYSIGEIASSFSAAAVEGTAILKISISHKDPSAAAEIVNAIADEAPEGIMKFVAGSSVKVVDFAKEPTAISYPSYTKMAMIGAAIGAGITLVVIVMLVIFNSYIEDEDDITKLFDAPIIGKIPDFNQFMAEDSSKKIFRKKGGSSK